MMGLLLLLSAGQGPSSSRWRPVNNSGLIIAMNASDCSDFPSLPIHYIWQMASIYVLRTLFIIAHYKVLRFFKINKNRTIMYLLLGLK